MAKIMAVNAGSSSIKFQLLEMPSEEVITSGIMEKIGTTINGENVPGILSAAPNGTHITEMITKGFEKIGYEILADLKQAVVNASDYGVPQNRNRVVIVGVRKEIPHMFILTIPLLILYFIVC